jgi:hypothetical protein
MKAKPHLIAIVILLALALAVQQGGLIGYSQAQAQTAPGTGPGVFLPLMVGGNPPKTTVFGIGVSGLSNNSGLSDTENAKPTWIRQDGLNWSLVQPTQNGAYDWSSASALEADMIKASQLGYNWIQVVRGTPSWAQKYPGSGCGPIKQSEFASFGNFLKAAVERYSKPPYNAMYWEIYNEPDAPIINSTSGFGCWGDSTQPYFGGQYYGNMLATIIPVMRQANPNIKILNGGLLLACDPSLSTCQDKDPSSFLEGIAKAGAIQGLDYVNFHAYDYQGVNLGKFGNGDGWGTTYENDTVVVAKAAFVRNVLNKYGLGNKPLVNSEVALLRTSGTCDAVCQQNKALYIGRAFPDAIAEGLAANIWYQASNGWNNSGLYGGPMYDAFVFARDELADTHLASKITTYAGANVSGYELDRGDIKVWVLWSLDLQTHTVTLPGTPKAVYTWTPNNGPYVPATPSTSQDIGIFPVYLEWTK